MSRELNRTMPLFGVYPTAIHPWALPSIIKSRNRGSSLVLIARKYEQATLVQPDGTEVVRRHCALEGYREGGVAGRQKECNGHVMRGRTSLVT